MFLQKSLRAEEFSYAMAKAPVCYFRVSLKKKKWVAADELWGKKGKSYHFRRIIQ